LFVDSFDLSFDVLLLTETWLQPSTFSSEIFCSKYVVYRRDRRHHDSIRTLTRRGGGVLIAHLNKFASSEVVVPCAVDIEFCCIKIELKTSHLFLVCLYIPPGSRANIYLQHWQSLTFVTSLLSSHDRIIVAGDFNLPMVSWHKDDSQLYLQPIAESVPYFSVINDFISLGLFQINFVKNANSKILDCVFVDNPDQFRLFRSPPLTLPEDLHHPTLEININIGDNTEKKTPAEFKFNFKRTNTLL